MSTIDVPMPKWGDTMQVGVLVKWRVGAGDRVDQGTPLATIETDKVNAEIEAPVAGTIVELLASEGAEVPVGEAVARIEPT